MITQLQIKETKIVEIIRWRDFSLYNCLNKIINEIIIGMAEIELIITSVVKLMTIILLTP